MKRKHILTIVLFSLISILKPAFADNVSLKGSLEHHLDPFIDRCIDFTMSGKLPDVEPFIAVGWEKVSAFGVHTYRKNVTPDKRKIYYAFLFYRKSKTCQLEIPSNQYKALSTVGNWIARSIKKHGYQKRTSPNNGQFVYAKGKHKIIMRGNYYKGVSNFSIGAK